MGSARPGGLSSGGTRSRHAAVFELCCVPGAASLPVG